MSTTLSQPRTAFTRALAAGLTGGVVAAVVNAAIYVTAQSLNGGPLMVQAAGSPQPLSLAAVLLFSVAPGLVAGVIYWALARFTQNPARWFLLLSGLVFIVFLFGPLSSASGAVAVWALELMHVGTAVPVLWALLGRRS